MNEISQAIMDHFLETGKPATIADLARRLSVQSRTVRRRLAADFGPFGIPDGCGQTGLWIRRRNVMAWQPSRHYLRQEVLNLQDQMRKPN